MIDIERLLTDLKIPFKKQRYSDQNGNVDAHTKYWITCLFDSSHTGKDAVIIQYDNGAIVYKCLHNSCKSKRWSDVIKLLRSQGVDFRLYGAEGLGSAVSVNQSQSCQFSFIKISDLEIKKPEWVIKGVHEARTLNLDFSDPGNYKSFWNAGKLFCVAVGIPFYGMPVKQGPVFLIAGEGFNGWKRRFMALSIRHQIPLDNLPIFMSTASVSIGDPDSLTVAIDQISQLSKEYQDPSLIVVDTVARNFGPGDENSTKDMNAFIQGCDQIKDVTGAAVSLVHHSGHGDKSRGRGSMALKGALDSEFRLENDSDMGVIRISCTKMKEFRKPDPMAFKIRVVELGIHEDDGEMMTSVVLDRVEYKPPEKKSNQVKALSILKDIYTHQSSKLKGQRF